MAFSPQARQSALAARQGKRPKPMSAPMPISAPPQRPVSPPHAAMQQSFANAHAKVATRTGKGPQATGPQAFTPTPQRPPAPPVSKAPVQRASVAANPYAAAKQAPAVKQLKVAKPPKRMKGGY